MKKKATTSFILGVVLSAIALYFAFRNVQFNDLLSYVAGINYIWILPAVLVALFAFVLRALRWQIILESTKKIGFSSTFHPMMIGFMINCILPGRLGEVARPVILKKNENIPFTTGMATIAAERAFDIGFLLTLFVVLLTTVDIDPNVNMTFGDFNLSRKSLISISEGMLHLCLLLIGGIICISIKNVRNIIKKGIILIPAIFFYAGADFKKKVETAICNPLIKIIDNIASGFSLIQSPKKLIKCAVLSICIWLFSALSYFIMAQGCPGIELSFLEITEMMIIICFFIALPSIPGWWGIWEAGGVFALALFSVPYKEAFGFTLVNHVIQVFPVIIVGMLSAFVTGMRIMQVAYGENQ